MAAPNCAGRSAGFWIGEFQASTFDELEFATDPTTCRRSQRQEIWNMRVFVAGASGAVGRELVPALISAGHAVAGLTRSPERAKAIKGAGALPIVADVFDAPAIRQAFDSFQPEIVIHELTGLSGLSDLIHFDRTFAATNRLRSEGTDLLLAAAREVGARRFIAQSFCGWPYERKGGAIKSESEALDADPPAEQRRSLEAIEYLERTVTGSRVPVGIVLRYGNLYGVDTGMLDPAAIDLIRRRRFPLIGDGTGWWSFLHVADAASATVAAIGRGASGEIYNVADDEPAQVKRWLPALAAMLGARPPLHVPAWIGRLAAGEHMVSMMTQVRAGSNDKAKRALGWRPAHPSWRAGFAQIIQQHLAHRWAA
jgi:nucleoside-diphosphate-sugar epimerase